MLRQPRSDGTWLPDSILAASGCEDRALAASDAGQTMKSSSSSDHGNSSGCTDGADVAVDTASGRKGGGASLIALLDASSMCSRKLAWSMAARCPVCCANSLADIIFLVSD